MRTEREYNYRGYNITLIDDTDNIPGVKRGQWAWGNVAFSIRAKTWEEAERQFREHVDLYLKESAKKGENAAPTDEGSIDD